MKLDTSTAGDPRPALWWVLYYVSRALHRVWIGKVGCCVVVTSEDSAEVGAEFARWLRAQNDGANLHGDIEITIEQIPMDDEQLVVTQHFTGGITSPRGRWISSKFAISDDGVFPCEP
ncbi:hypothetical protein N9S00_08105 [Luminiphilus sp.]|nr:hypothetical protein [Luminiphilus sp.]